MPNQHRVPYWKSARSAMMVKSFADDPRGSYLWVSHSLIVCWRVPSCSAIFSWVRPRWLRNARTSLLVQRRLIPFVIDRKHTRFRVRCQGAIPTSGRWRRCFRRSEVSRIPMAMIPSEEIV